MLPISNSEDDDDPSRVRVPAPGLPPPLAGEAVASWLVLSSAFLLTGKGQAQHAPPTPEAPMPRRLPSLSTRLLSLVGWGARTCACAPLARGEKPAGSPEADQHRGLRLPQPPRSVLRDH